MRMAGRKVLAITERQFAVLRVLWEHGPLTVRGLMEHLPRGDRQPYTTVLGLLQGMEKAGLVDHEKEGLTHRYRPDRLAAGGHREPALRLPGAVLPRVGRAVDPRAGRRRAARPGRPARDRGPARRRWTRSAPGASRRETPRPGRSGGGRSHDRRDGPSGSSPGWCSWPTGRSAGAWCSRRSRSGSPCGRRGGPRPGTSCARVALAAGVLLPVAPRWGVAIVPLAVVGVGRVDSRRDRSGDAARPGPKPGNRPPTSTIRAVGPGPRTAVRGRADAGRRRPRSALGEPLGAWRLAALGLAAIWALAGDAALGPAGCGGRCSLARLRAQGRGGRRGVRTASSDECRRALGLSRPAGLAVHPAVASPVGDRWPPAAGPRPARLGRLARVAPPRLPACTS